jgi:hypothetical protein
MTTIDFIEYVCEQIEGVGTVRYKKMFGDYMVYVNDKPLLLVCDNMVYVKLLPELTDVMADANQGVPYSGAKAHYILDIDDVKLARKVIAILEPITAIPQSRTKQSKLP